MLRLSATQLELFQQCPRKWFYQYVIKIKPPPNRSQGLGSRVHQILEEYNKSGKIPDRNETYQFSPDDRTFFPGRIALLALSRLPKPGVGRVEGEFIIKGNVADYIGYIDLETDERVIDFKTSSDPKRWAKTEETLRTDPQAILYGLKKALDDRVNSVTLEWLYLKISGSGKPWPVEVELEKTHIDDEFAKIEEQARVMEEIATSAAPDVSGCRTLVPNPSACFLFGGCPHRERCNLSDKERLEAIMDANDLLSKMKQQIAGRINPPETSDPRITEGKSAVGIQTNLPNEPEPEKETKPSPKRKRRTKLQIALDNYVEGKATDEQLNLLEETAKAIAGKDMISDEDENFMAVLGQTQLEQWEVDWFQDPEDSLGEPGLQSSEDIPPEKQVGSEADKKAYEPPAAIEEDLGTVLCIGCFVVSGFKRTVMFENLLKACSDAYCKNYGIPNYRIVDYRKGIASVAGILEANIRENPNLIKDHVIIAPRDLEREFREVLIPYCSDVYEASTF